MNRPHCFKVLSVVLLLLAALAWLAGGWLHPDSALRAQTAAPSPTHATSATTPPGPTKPATAGDFVAWARSVGRESDPGPGRELALQRRASMKRLIESDPARALAEALPWEVRENLPEEIKTLIEEPVAAMGDYEVQIACGLGEEPGRGIEHFAVLGDSGRRLRVYPFGRRLDVTTKRGIALHGVAVDDVMALAEDPLRIPTPAERQARGLAGNTVEIGGRLYTFDSEASLTGLRRALEDDELTLGPRPGRHYQALPAGQIEGVTPVEPVALPVDGSVPDPGLDEPPLASPHTEGAKTMLYIRARFADQDPAFEPLDLATLQSRQGDVEQYWQDNSYGKSTLTTTYTTTVTLAGINTPTSTTNTPGLAPLLTAARMAAKQANPAWNDANFDFSTVLTSGGSGWGYAGVAWVGGNGSHLNGASSSNPRTAFHEFGHNLGLRHANYWRTDSPSPIGRDSVPGGYRGDAVDAEPIEYGHRHSTMSAQDGSGDLNAGRGHFTTGEKVKLEWLVQGDGDWRSIISSASIRLYRQDLRATDLATASNGVPRAIKINRDTDDYVDPSNRRRYWLSYRTLPTDGVSGNWLPYGVQVDWQRNTYGGDGSILLDMTPYTRNSTTVGGGSGTDNSDKEDGVILVGRTYTDRVADIHITPTAYGGTAPNQWMDVTVNIGTQATNTPPTITSFTATATRVATGTNVTFNVSATDPNGDALAYAWDYSDASRVLAALNNSRATKSWSTAGQYVVRVTVSDMKGGTDTREVVVTVGNPTEVYQITGRILQGGLPVAGARVNIGDSYQAWTEADGTYTLAGLPLGSHTVTAAALNLSFTPQFVNPVQLTSLNAYGKDFLANEGLSGSGGLTLAVSPYEIVIPYGDSVQFTALGWDGAGQTVAVNPSWAATGGTIGTNGFYEATAPGTYTITATQGATNATATVIVSPPVRYWDTSTGSGLTGGNGNWVNAVWSDTTNGTALTTILDGFDAFFQADTVKSSTVSIPADSTVTAGTVTVDNANIVTLKSGGNLTATLRSTAIAVKGASTVKFNGASFVVGTPAYSPSLTLEGDSTVEYLGNNSPNVRNTTFGAVTFGAGNNTFRTTAETGGDGIALTFLGLTGDSDDAIVLARSTDSLTVNNATENAFGGVISGPSKLTKTGSGALTLDGANLYTGSTIIGGGTLLVNGSIAAGAVTVSNSAALGGSGTIRGPIVVNSGATLKGGDVDGFNTLTASNSLTLGNTTNAVTYSQFLVAAGGKVACNSLTVAGTNIVNILDSDLAVGTNTLFTYGGGAIGGSGFAGFKLGALPFGVNARLLNTGSAVRLGVQAVVNTNPPAMTGSYAAGALTLSWPADRLGWRLEFQTNTLTAGNWSTWPGSTNVTSVIVTNNLANPAIFFRLVYP